MKLQKKAENLILDPILAHLAEIWTPSFFLVSFISTNSKTLFQAIILCNLKEN